MNRNMVTRRHVLAGGAVALGAGVAASMAMAEEAARDGAFAAGTYESIQTTGYATVRVVCNIEAAGVASVSYDVVSTSDDDYFTPLATAAEQYCADVAANGGVAGVDAISGASLCTEALRAGVLDCQLQALGIEGGVYPEPRNPQDWTFASETSDCAALFTPIQVGSLTLRNRFVKSAGSSPWKGVDGAVPSPVAFDLYGTMADSGVAMIVLTSSVFRGLGFSQTDKVSAASSDEEAVALAAALVERIHQGGAYAALQLSMGSPVGDPKVNDYTVEELEAYVQATAAVAQRWQSAGGDAIEIKGATQDDLNAFFSRRFNKREDDYGPQSIESRTKLYCDMVRAIKEACGEDFTVLALINAVEEYDYAPGADPACLSIGETRQIAQAIVAAGCDAVQVRLGAPGQEATCFAPDAMHFAYGADGLTGFGHLFDYATAFGGLQDGAHSGIGAFVPMAAAIKEAVDVPVGCAGAMDPRFAPALINGAVEQGLVDLVYMNRPLNADPWFVQKLSEGRPKDIMPCNHCFHCHDSIASGSVLGCARMSSCCRVNATIQKAYTDAMPEGFDPLPADEPRRVAVVGGGAAGLEAARIAARRGHTVALFEKAPRLGGLLPFAAAVKGPHESLLDYRDWLVRQVEQAGVEIACGTEADAEALAGFAPDVVVVATGGVRPELGLEGNDSVRVLDFEGAAGCNCGQDVVLVGGSVQASDMALRLMAMGKRVQIVNPGTLSDFDAQQSAWFQGFAKAHFSVNGVKIWNNAQVTGIAESGLAIVDETGAERVLPCDTVVPNCDLAPNASLADDLASAGYEVVAVGDCAQPWSIQRAVSAANLAARAL